MRLALPVFILNKTTHIDWQKSSQAALAARLEQALLPVSISDGTDAIKREGQRVAAVLGLFVKRSEGWQIVLTQRPETMPSHPGQISFPGGKKEEGESVEEAALRETEEEIGVRANQITLIGRLPSFDAVSAYRVTPFFGVLDPSAEMIPNPGEVEDVFDVPAAFLMNPKNHQPRDVYFDGQDHRLIDMPYDDRSGVPRNIWGMTSMMIYRLYQRLYED